MPTYTPGPYSGGLADLPRYVSEELTRISAAISLDTGAASLFRTSEDPGTPIVVDAVPFPIEFAAQTPERDALNVVPDLPSRIVVRRGGIWGVAFTLEAQVEPQGIYEVRLFANDVASALSATIDPSNQTDVVSISALGTQRVNQKQGPVSLSVDLRVSSDSARDWQLLSGYFSVWRIGP
jgi:hypothetical protein